MWEYLLGDGGRIHFWAKKHLDSCMIWCSLVILTAVHSSRLKTGTVRVWHKEIGSKFDFMFTVDHISCNPHRAPRHCRFDYYQHVAKGPRQDEPPGGEIRGQFSVAFGQTRIPNSPFWPDKDSQFPILARQGSSFQFIRGVIWSWLAALSSRWPVAR